MSGEGALKKYWKAIAIVVAIFAVLGAVVVHSIRQGRSMTAETTGTLASVKFVKDDESSSLDSTDLAYSFAVDGKTYTGTDSDPGDRTADYRIGQALKVCYNPEDPSVSRVNAPDAPCG